MKTQEFADIPSDVKTMLCCPYCKGELSYQGPYKCPECGREYPHERGIIDFLPKEDDVVRGFFQRLDRWAFGFSLYVDFYESKYWRGSDFFARYCGGINLEEEKALIRRIVDLGPQDTVLDIGCGPGIYARDFAARGAERTVVGLDITWPMLESASAKSQKEGLTNITYLHGDAHFLPFRDSTMDAVNCTGAFHCFPDRDRALNEVDRVLKDGGRFSLALFRKDKSRNNLIAKYAFIKPGGAYEYESAELSEQLERAGFEPAIYHDAGIWIVAGGVKRARRSSREQSPERVTVSASS